MCACVRTCGCLLLLLNFVLYLSCSIVWQQCGSVWFIYLSVVVMFDENPYLKFYLSSNLGNHWFNFMKYVFFCPILFLHLLGHPLHICWTVWYYLLGPEVLFTVFCLFLCIFHIEWFLLFCIQANLLFPL